MRGLGTTGALSATDLVARRLRGGAFDWRSALLEGAMLLALLLAFGILFVLLVDIVQQAMPVLTERPIDFLTSPVSSRPTRAGIVQGLGGSLLLMVFVALVALPLGIGAAVYLEEYAKDRRLTRFIRTNIRNLAGVPAIVYGLLGLAVFVVALLANPGADDALIAGAADAGRAGAADRDHHRVGGAAGGPRQHPGGRLRRGRHALGDRCAATSCRTRHRGS